MVMSRQHHAFYVHLSKKKQKDLFDKLVGVAAFLYPLSSLPQMVLVFQGSTDGVSVVSWLGFAAFSTLFLVYGLVHKIRPVIVTNFLWVLVDLFIVFGTLTHRMIG